MRLRIITWLFAIIGLSYCVTVVYATSKDLMLAKNPGPYNQLPFNSDSWKAQPNSKLPEKGPLRQQMIDDACKKVNGEQLSRVLLLLGPPDYIGKVRDLDPTETNKHRLKGNVYLCYSADTYHWNNLVVSIGKDDRVEAAFEDAE